MRWWYRIQIAVPLIGILNLCLLSISVTPILADYSGIPRKLLILALPPIALCCLALVGYALDRVHWAQRQERESVARSPSWSKVLESLERIEAKMRNPRR